MTDEYAIYRDYQKAMQYAEQQKVNQFSREYDSDDMEGFKMLFPMEEKPLEPESNEPF